MQYFDYFMCVRHRLQKGDEGFVHKLSQPLRPLDDVVIGRCTVVDHAVIADDGHTEPPHKRGHDIADARDTDATQGQGVLRPRQARCLW